MSDGQETGTNQRSPWTETAAVGGTLGFFAGLAAGWQFPQLALAIGGGSILAVFHRKVLKEVKTIV